MLKIITVCGNGIGSSLMLKMKIEEICAENNIQGMWSLSISTRRRANRPI